MLQHNKDNVPLRSGKEGQAERDAKIRREQIRQQKLAVALVDAVAEGGQVADVQDVLFVRVCEMSARVSPTPRETETDQERETQTQTGKETPT